jgi:hypothetical protein
MDDDEVAHKAKMAAGMFLHASYAAEEKCADRHGADAKAKKDLADSLKGKKGPINTGGQGIKKSGKK